ncbi:ribonuclease P protein component 4 [Pyrodictium occultum]|uniref:ribonuclease P protein component 4 n=1 Tax=Pyrodictium occultum TaxID=2309 RepID=UPI001F1CE7A6
MQAVHRLYRLAVDAARRGDVDYARALVREADELRRRLRLPKPWVLRRGVCRGCGAPLVPGITARVRLVRDGRVTRLVVACLICGYLHRYIVRVRRSRAEGASIKAEGAGSAGARGRDHREERAERGRAGRDRPPAEGEEHSEG